MKATPNPKAAITNQPILLKATNATELNLRFPGQYADDETGLFYNYYRNYLASQGRYTQNDPIGLAGGLNRVGYVGGNPLLVFDPTGEIGWIAILGLSGTAYGMYTTWNLAADLVQQAQSRPSAADILIDPNLAEAAAEAQRQCIRDAATLGKKSVKIVYPNPVSTWESRWNQAKDLWMKWF